MRFSTFTLSAFQTMIPFSPACPPLTLGPKFCADFLSLHRAVCGLVPSTTTLLRLMPRSVRLRVWMTTPAGNWCLDPRGNFQDLVL